MLTLVSKSLGKNYVQRESSNSLLVINKMFIVVALLCNPFLLKYKISDMNISCL